MIEQIRQCRATVTQALQQRYRQCLKIQAGQGADPSGAERISIKHVIELGKAFRISRVVLDGRSVKPHDVQQILMRITAFADPSGALTHVAPIGIQLA